MVIRTAVLIGLVFAVFSMFLSPAVADESSTASTESQLTAAPAPAPAPAPAEENAEATGKREVVLFSDKGRVFAPLLADPREAQFRLGFLDNNDSDILWDFVFGADVALARTREADGADTSLTVRGLMAPRFEFGTDSFNLLNTDFVGGLAYGRALGDNAWEVFVYHQSSHLGDEEVETGARERIDYSHESVRFLMSRKYNGLRLYGGPTYTPRANPDAVERTFVAQGGAEYRFAAGRQPMYAALDLQSREENDWAVNAALQVGVELGDPAKVAKRQRVFLELFTGHSVMGQFFNETESYALVGVGYNF